MLLLLSQLIGSPVRGGNTEWVLQYAARKGYPQTPGNVRAASMAAVCLSLAGMLRPLAHHLAGPLNVPLPQRLSAWTDRGCGAAPVGCSATRGSRTV